jgi:hypothetical protein
MAISARRIPSPLVLSRHRRAVDAVRCPICVRFAVRRTARYLAPLLSMPGTKRGMPCDRLALRVTGMLKADEKKKDVIHLSLKYSCSNWIAIPINMVEPIEYIRRSACSEHSHPVARVTFSRATPAEARHSRRSRTRFSCLSLEPATTVASFA